MKTVIADLCQLELFLAINEIDVKHYEESIRKIQSIVNSMKEDATCEALKIKEVI
jgi:hypothetical protein